jgi:hypothetical protein
MTLMAVYAATMRRQQVLPTISNSGLLIAGPAYARLYIRRRVLAFTVRLSLALRATR